MNRTTWNSVLICGLLWGLQSNALGALARSGAAAWVAQENREQERTLRVEVMVSALAGQDVYLDKGRQAGLAINDVVRLEPLTGASVSATIISVSRDGARARLSTTASEVEIGTQGSVLIPADRIKKAPVPVPEPAQPAEQPESGQDEGTEIEIPLPKEPQKQEPEAEHPPWESPPEEWDSGAPLLAPAHARPIEEREVRLRGRAFTSLDQTRDRANGTNTYSTLVSGVDLDLENLFGHGGRVQIDLNYLAQEADLDDGSEQSDKELRVGRASYGWGGLRGQPNAWEVGRFLHREFSELGLIDGVEHNRRSSSGHRYGASFGYLPELGGDLRTGDDLALSAYYRYVSGEEERLALGAAYQKSWHQGSADRDLLIGSFSFRPDASTSIYATTFVDLYTSGDDLKSSSLELTQINLNANWRSTSGYGFSLFGSELRFPDIERQEFQGLTPEQVADNFSRRLGLGSWVKTSQKTRLSARVDRWEDQDDDGGNASLRFSARDLLFERGGLHLELFNSDGKFSKTSGARLSADKRFGVGSGRLSWNVSSNEQNNFIGGQEDLLQHSLRASFDTNLGSQLSLSLFADTRFGDEQDSMTIGFYLQRAF